MSESTRAIRKELNNEIKLLEERYGTIWGYLRGTDFDYLIILESLQAFSEGLKRISTHIMALYQLEGQKTKITWDPLLNNIDEFLKMNQPPQNAKYRLEYASSRNAKTIEILNYNRRFYVIC